MTRQLERRDVTLYVDLTNMEAGAYDVKVSVRIADEAAQKELTHTLSVSSIKVTIRK